MGSSKFQADIRPAFVPGVLYPTAVAGTLVLAAALATHWVNSLIGASPFSALVLAAVGFLGVLILFFHWKARWAKTKLSFLPGHLRFETGGLGSKSATELSMQNVTHLGYELPILESFLFGSGKIKVESAGSGGAEVDIFHVTQPEEAFDRVAEAMVLAGIPLAPEDPLIIERPALWGVLWDELGFLLVFGFLLTGMIGALWLLKAPVLLSLGLILLSAGFMIGWMVIKFVDAKSQVCTLFETNITFYGELPKRTTIIPMANVADSDVNQSLVSRLLGLWTLKVSCQGAGNEISIRNLPGGQNFSQTLLAHLQKRKDRTQPNPSSKSFDSEDLESLVGSRSAPHSSRPTLKRDRQFQGQFHMTLVKNILLPLSGMVICGCLAFLLYSLHGIQSEDAQEFFGLLLFLSASGLFHAIRLGIQSTCTTFTVGTDEVTEKFSFIAKTNKTFSFDKATALVVARGPLDRIFQTATYRFFSIGSAEDITFRGIPFDPNLERNLLSKYGIQSEKAAIELGSHFSFGEMIKAQPALLLGLGFVSLVGLTGAWFQSALPALIAGASFLVCAIPALVYNLFYFPTSRLQFLEHSICFQRGIFIQERTHVTYDNVKDLTVTHYPFSKLGDLRINIAGEFMPEAQAAQAKQAQALGKLVGAKPSGLTASNSFLVQYLDQAGKEAFFLDRLQKERPPIDQFQAIRSAVFDGSTEKPVTLARPSLARHMFPLSCASALFAALGLSFCYFLPDWAYLFPLALVPVLLACVFYLVYLRQKKYLVEAGVVAIESGLIYRTRKTITFDQIDFTQVSQGIIDQVFKTGNVHVHTTGSSQAEMVLAGFQDYESFAKTLKRHSQSAGAVVDLPPNETEAS